MESFVAGIVAGYGIAIPVGAIAILIVQTSIRSGLTVGLAAGAGAATADLTYAALAVVGGATLSGLVETIDAPLRIASGLVLIVIAIVGLRAATRPADADNEVPGLRQNNLVGTFSRFLGLTIINPTTVVYFAAVIIGLGVASDMTLVSGLVFVAGAFLASLSWQSFLAIVGSSAGARLTPRAQQLAVMVGNVLILALAVFILIP
jgi:threonine/homoserine/homoserine lactone efflux protein